MSDSPDFDDLMGVSDIFVPAVRAWVGDYPYLDKEQFRAFLSQKLKKEKKERRRSQASEGDAYGEEPFLLEAGKSEEWMDGEEIWDAGKRKKREWVDDEVNG